MSEANPGSSPTNGASDAKSTINAWIIMAIGPFLIMLLIGSLIFFLLEVFYAGEYPARVKYIFTLYTFAIVLVGRISIEEGHGYATVFGLPLALATVFVSSYFLKGDAISSTISMLILVLLVGIVWFAADRLTWDCTVVDFSKDVSNEGLLSAVRSRIRDAGETVKTVSEDPNILFGTDSHPEHQAESQVTADAPIPTNFAQDAIRRQHLTRQKTGGAWAQKEEKKDWESGGQAEQRPTSDQDRSAADFGLDDQGNPVDKSKLDLDQSLYGSSSRGPSQLQQWWGRLPIGKRKQNSPGVWVIYFSLAAIPIFGIGQAFVPATMVESRQRVFFYFVVYTLAALGLLMTTSLMGLQRYLRKRQVEFPDVVAISWVATGAALILAILSLAWLFPRPAPEYSFLTKPLKWVSSDKLNPSDYGWGNDGKEEGSGGKADDNAKSGGADGKSKQDRSGGNKSGEASQGKAGSKSDNSKSGGSQKGDKGGKQSGNDQSNQGKSNKSDQSNQSNSKSDSSDNDSSSQNSSDSQDSSSDQSKSDSDQGEQGKSSSEDESQDGKSGDSNDSKSNNSSSGQGNDNQDSKSKSESKQNKSSGGGSSQSRNNNRQNKSDESKGQGGKQNSRPSPANQAAESVGNFFATLVSLGKWLIVALLIVALLVACWFYRHELKEAVIKFKERLLELLDRLFGNRKKKKVADELPLEERRRELAQPFSSFRDPFESGQWKQWSAKELLAYSMAAFEAWGREHGSPRGIEQTPGEYAKQIAKIDRDVGHAARKMAELYATVAFGPKPPQQVSPELLQKFWQLMRQRQSHERRQLTAGIS